MPASLHSRLRAADPLLGTFIKSADPLSVEVLAAAGLDVLVIDLEHSSLGLGTSRIYNGQLRHTVPDPGTTAPDRLADAGRAVEAGSAGIQVSGIETLGDLRNARRAIRFAPDGNLGFSLTHPAGGFGLTAPSEYLRRVTEDTVLIAQLESVTALAALPTMLDVEEGPDVWFFGPMDLAASQGHPGNPGHPDVQSAIKRAAQLVRESGQAFGLAVTTDADAHSWRELGASLVLHGADLALLAERARTLVDCWERPVLKVANEDDVAVSA